MSTNPKVVSAGGLVVRYRESVWEAALVGSGTPTIWRIPKGMQNEGETLEQTAIREVCEEAGILGTILEFIGTASWTYTYQGRDWDETVYFFLMRLVDGSTENHDEEFERVQWFPAEEVQYALYFQSEKDIAKKFVDLLKKYPVES